MPTMNINGRELFYYDQGEGFPLLFGHSYLWDADMWAPQLEELSQEYRCIAVDLWDHGRSGPLNAESYSMKQLADDYWQLMQNLNIDKFAVVGLSIGGMWGTQLALDHPEAVSPLVIMDTYVGPEPENTKQQYEELMAAILAQNAISKEIATTVAPLFFSSVTMKKKPEMANDLIERLTSIPAEKIPGIVQLGHTVFSRKSLLDRLPSIKQPTLIVVGRDDIPRPPAEAQKMAMLIPNSQLAIVEDAGHIANLERPNHITRLLKLFLQEVLAQEKVNQE